MKKIILTLLLIALFFGCDVANDSVDNTASQPGSSNSDATVVVSRGKMYDANNVLIGNAVNIDGESILLVTSTGYMVNFFWSGDIKPSKIHYTESDGAGTAFDYNSSYSPYSKECHLGNGKYYIYRDIENGVAVIDPSITSYLSRYDRDSDAITNESSAMTVYSPAFALKEIQRSELGLVETIVGPLTIKFD